MATILGKPWTPTPPSKSTIGTSPVGQRQAAMSTPATLVGTAGVSGTGGCVETYAPILFLDFLQHGQFVDISQNEIEMVIAHVGSGQDLAGRVGHE